MVKQSAQKLVKYLRSKSSDEIFELAKKHSLGQYLGKNRAIKTLGGRGEGVAELVGDPKRGVNVRKFTDVANSPVTDLPTMAEKIRIQKKLNKDPRTKDLFTQYIPGSFKANKAKTVTSHNTTYSKGMPTAGDYASDATFELTDKFMRGAPRAQAQASKVTGSTIHDIAENRGNYNPRQNEVIDFSPEGAIKGGEDLNFLRRFEKIISTPGHPKAEKLRKGLQSHQKTRESYGLIKYRKAEDSMLKNERGLENLPIINPRAKSYLEASVDLRDYFRKIDSMTPDQRLTGLKKEFYRKS